MLSCRTCPISSAVAASRAEPDRPGFCPDYMLWHWTQGSPPTLIGGAVGADAGTSTGRQMIAVLGGLADVERELIRNRDDS